MTPVLLTGFRFQVILDFSRSCDRKQLAISRRQTSHLVVMLTDTEK